MIYDVILSLVVLNENSTNSSKEFIVSLMKYVKLIIEV